MAVSIDNMHAGLGADVQFRAMTYADLKQVIAIEKTAYTHPWTIGIFRDCIRVGYSSWVCQQDNKVVGYGIIMLSAGEAHILNICVDPQLQGKGLGRNILCKLVEHCTLTGADMVLLEVRRSNEIAAQLYQSEGFHELGVRKNYYPSSEGREDAIIFAKYISPASE